MSDAENQQQVDLLLESLWQAQPEFERRFNAYIDAAEAYLALAERDSSSSRLGRLRQAAEKAFRTAELYYRTQEKNIEAIRAVLNRWKSPGREYARFVDEAHALTDNYVTIINEIVTNNYDLRNRIDAIDAAAR